MLNPAFIQISFTSFEAPLWHWEKFCAAVPQDNFCDSEQGPGLKLCLPLLPDKNLAQNIYLSGLLLPPPLCSGIGTCGQCKVLFLSSPPRPTPEDLHYFSQSKIQEGWRLSCQHRADINTVLLLPSYIKPSPKSRCLEIPDPQHSKATKENLIGFLGIDLGTTSIHWKFCLENGQDMGSGQSLNPQIGAGSDVVSRMSVASTPEGRNILQNLAVEHFKNILEEINVFGGKAQSIVVAANPIMQSIVLGLDTSSLGSAPYHLPHPGGTLEKIKDLPEIWMPPNLSPFVGGDISAGYASILSHTPFFPFLLADLGTNGELLLAVSPEKSVVCSVALGPALEGIGLSCGNIAEPGAITNFQLSPTGLDVNFYEPDKVPSLTQANGITATGYLSLLNILLHCQVISQEGHFTEKSRYIPQGRLTVYREQLKTYRQKEGLPELDQQFCLALPYLMYLDARDIEEFLKVKAAFSLGLRLLLSEAGVAAQQLKGIYVAGALGNHINPHVLANLGFIPQGLQAKIHAAGNTSLNGACLLAASANAREQVCSWAKKVEFIDLANNEAFLSQYPEHMRFSW